MPTQSKPPTPRKKTTKVSKLATLLRFDAGILKDLSPDCRLIGLDEVGRGSLISSVVGGAVCLPRKLNREQKRLLTWLDDSKKLTAPVRAELSEAIQSFCLTGIGATEKDEVDELNVHYASLLALYRALQQLCEKAELCPNTGDVYLIMDGKAVIPDYRPGHQRAIIKGDGCSAAIAAASVIAKHHRDSMVQRLALEYPGYGWEDNMGYPTPAHLQGIRTLGITPLHRKNFKRVHEQLKLALTH
jgi:ribonuclease HII